MIYMGLDCSTTSSGVSIFNDEELIYYDNIKPKSKDWEERVGILSVSLNKILSEFTNIEMAFIEDVPLKNGKHTLKKLSCVRGAIKATLALNGVPLTPRQVNEWRQDAGFYDGTTKGMTREEMKKKAISEVENIFGIKVNDDIAEGILVAYRTKYPKQKIVKEKSLRRKRG